MERAVMLDRWRDLIRASPGRLTGTWRTVLAVGLVALVMITFQMPFLAVGPFLVFVISQRNLFLSRTVAILMVPILALSCLILYGVAAVAWDHAWLRVVLWIGIFWGGFFLMHILAEPRLIVVPLCIVALVSYSFDKYPYPNMILDQLGWIWALVGVCVACTFLTQWLTGVPTALEHLRQEFQRLLYLAEKICLACASGRRLPQFDHEGLHNAQEMAEKLGKAHILSPEQSENCIAVFGSLGAVAELARSNSPSDPVSDWTSVAEGVRVFGAQILGRSDAPKFPNAESQGPPALALDTLKQTLFTLSIASNTSCSKPEKKSLVADDALKNPAHVEFATRAMCATIGCYLLMSLTSWDGIHTCMITCVVTALADRVERHHKQRLRLGGALFGGLLGVVAFVYLVPLVDGIAGLLAILAGGTAVAAWVAQGSSRISYAGWQIGLAFYMILLQSPHANTHLDVIRDRWVGILLGIAAMRFAFAGFQSLRIPKNGRLDTVAA
jgi:multidrug resistance protein MdtO